MTLFCEEMIRKWFQFAVCCWNDSGAHLSEIGGDEEKETEV